MIRSLSGPKYYPCLLALAALAACGADPGNETAATGAAAPAANVSEVQRDTLGEALARSGEHARFVALLDSAAFAETLRGAGPYTVLAPRDQAFAALPEDAVAALGEPANRERLINLLRYHIVPGTVTVADMRRAIERGTGGRAELATMAGTTLSLSREGDAIVIGDAEGGRARLAGAEAYHANGVLHGIDAVLMPGEDAAN